jgi:hypothetical protein
VEARRFTVEEAQDLLDAELRELAERLVANRRAAAPLEAQWQRILLAIGGNGGGDVRHEASDLRSRLEQLQGEARELIRTITGHGVHLKDPARGLLDFPALVDGDDALLCWEVGEERIAWWHRPEDGYAGRRPLT